MHDLISFGEVLLRLSVPSPSRIEDTRQLDVQFGGAEANVAAACARLGLSAAWVSALPTNAWGERVRRELRGHGVDCSYVLEIPNARLGVYFLEYGVPPRPIRIVYDRRDSAFSRLTSDMVDWEPVRRARMVHVSGVTAALGDNARALISRLIDEAQCVSFDINYRASLWSPADARSFAESVLPRVRYLFLGQSEAETIFGYKGPPEATLARLVHMAPKATIAMLQGENGSAVLDRGRIFRPRVKHRVHVIDPIGAGDAYVAGYLSATLRGQDAQQAIDTAATVAALKCSTWGDIALITPRDVTDALAGGPDVRR